MLNNAEARGAIAPVVTPIARGLLRLGVTPDMVTWFGTAVAMAGALLFFPRGEFLWGLLVILLVIPSDLLDGTMARLSGRQGPWGAWLDSTLDRVADGAIFGALLIWAAWNQMAWTTAMAWTCLVGGVVISYAKARAESVGAHANVGIAERAERLIVGLGGVALQGFGVPNAITVALTALAVLTIITVYQRARIVRQQLLPASSGEQSAPTGDGQSLSDDAGGGQQAPDGAGGGQAEPGASSDGPPGR